MRTLFSDRDMRAGGCERAYRTSGVGRWRRIVPLVVIVLLTTALPSQAATALMKQALVVVPAGGYGGALVYLSASGYPARTKLTVTEACPSLKSNGPNQLVVGGPGPTTDKHGQFVAFPMRAVSVPTDAAVKCHFYTSSPRLSFGPRVPPAYTTYAQNTPIPLCAAQTCEKVTARRSGRRFTLAIEGWPGEKLDLRFEYDPTLSKDVVWAATAPRVPQQAYQTSLDWRGRATAVSAVEVRGMTIDGRKPFQIFVRVSGSFPGQQNIGCLMDLRLPAGVTIDANMCIGGQAASVSPSVDPARRGVEGAVKDFQ